MNVAVFLVCTFTGDLLYDRGRLDVYGVLVQKEYGRVVCLSQDFFPLLHLCRIHRTAAAKKPVISPPT